MKKKELLDEIVRLKKEIIELRTHLADIANYRPDTEAMERLRREYTEMARRALIDSRKIDPEILNSSVLDK